ncbi:MAG: hypothetical protein AB7I13_20070 [Vicinamibacterales bacterium]
MLERRAILNDFSVTTLEGATFAYGEIWQKKNLIAVSLGPGTRDPEYVARLRELGSGLGDHTTLVVTEEPVAGEAGPLALVADRYGEVYFVARAETAAALPPPGELGDWLAYLRMRCSA